MNNARLKELSVLIMVLSLVIGIKLINVFSDKFSADDDNDLLKVENTKDKCATDDGEVLAEQNIEVVDYEKEKNMIMVHVQGAVNSSGVYELPKKSRVYQAIDIAGGFSEQAQKDALNLADFVYDAQQIVVPYIGEEVNSENLSNKNKWSIADLNRASLTELQTIDGIGEGTAKKIIEYRESHGNFKKLDDLLNIKGIGKKTLQQWSDKFMQ